MKKKKKFVVFLGTWHKLVNCNCAILCQNVSYYAILCSTVSIHARLCQSMPGCSNPSQTVPVHARLCWFVPFILKFWYCAILCHTVLHYAILCRTVPTRAKLLPTVRIGIYGAQYSIVWRSTAQFGTIRHSLP